MTKISFMRTQSFFLLLFFCTFGSAEACPAGIPCDLVSVKEDATARDRSDGMGANNILPPSPNDSTLGSPPSKADNQMDLAEANKGKYNEGKGLEERELEKIRESKVQNDKAAKRALNSAVNRHKQQIINTSGKSASSSIILSDHEKIIKAQKAIRDKKLYSEALAKQARDAEIRKNLLIVAKATQKREELEKEENRLSAQIAELGQLASAAAAVANNLGEIKNPSSSKASVPVTQADSKDAGVSSVAEPKASAEKAAEVTEAKVDALTQQEKIALLKELDAGKSKTGSKIKDLSLKNKLVAELRAADAAEKKMATGSSNSAVTENGKRENAAAKVVSEVLDPSLEATDGYNRGGGGKSPAFSLSTSETAAEVKRMTDEAERQLATSAQAADDIKAGILELESPSLFERVKARITGCLRQHCVISKSVAQK